MLQQVREACAKELPKERGTRQSVNEKKMLEKQQRKVYSMYLIPVIYVSSKCTDPHEDGLVTEETNSHLIVQSDLKRCCK